MNRRYNLKEIYSFFEKVEFDYGLIDYKIDNVYFWKLIRISIWSTINNKVGLMGIAHPPRKEAFIEKLINRAKKEFNIYRYNAKKTKDQKDILIFKSPRKTFLEGEISDYYTHYIRKTIKSSNKRVLNLDLDTFHRQYSPPSYAVALPSIFSRRYCRWFMNIRFTESDVLLLNEIEKRIEYKFNIKLNIKELIRVQIFYYRYNYKYYWNLYKKIKPKKIILVCSYGNEALISAAQDLGIEVYEVQHGTISKYHLGYSFTSNKKVPYFPDYLMIYGDYWFDSTPIPLSSEKILNIGFPYLTQQLEHYKDNEKIKNSVIFISQGTIGKELSEIAFEFAKKNTCYNVTYKLHPSEFNDWRAIYPRLNEGMKLSNFKIVDDNKINLYQLLSESEYQVGVYSTALYEGLILNAKTILVSLPGVENLEYLLDEKIVMIANTADELKDSISNYKTKPFNKIYFFSDANNHDKILQTHFFNK
ncbi:hypothetical protein DES38_10317 [Streptohalobacillus salinus]|uniref:Capsular polysaccharide biosynthesis protein n=1 Tax=Streptohalobacillus salinus TaxID=621096 RepID=A0A2V3WCH5_9BACI|nr:hypothetical protein [Streptohalobacillus salinus]PXW92002.1 hypothetical protein DES38_10317 [Streptohalobacillus salinus]